jgi:hypothetical protein
MVTVVKSRRGTGAAGTIYLDILTTHRHHLSVRTAIFVLHTANELSGLALIFKLQLSVALRKGVPPTHKRKNNWIVFHGFVQCGDLGNQGDLLSLLQ